jgi:hypothetical protein
MNAALGTVGTPAHAEATDAPYEDEWGTFMTGWAPLPDASGQRAVVGVDIDASLYVHRLQVARNWALACLIPAALVIGLLGGLYYRARLRGLESTAATARAAEDAKRSAASPGSASDSTRSSRVPTSVPGKWMSRRTH